MLIVGYNDRQQVFIVRNSWGEQWGDKGYCYIPYDYAGNVDFNLVQQYIIRGISNLDFTPEADDGEDFDITEDPTPVVFEVDEDPEEPDVEDDFDIDEYFKGDQMVKQFFLERGGKLPRSAFALTLSLFNRGEGGKTFDWLAADAWLADDAEQAGHSEYWTPEDFLMVVEKFKKKSDAELYPNLAFLFQ